MIWQFASRYIRAKKSTQAINIISWVSMGAIAVGAAALIIVLSVFNGFEGLVKSLYSSFYPELKVSPVYGKTMLVPASKLDSLKAITSVEDVSRSLEEKALLQYNGEKMIVVLKGVDSSFEDVTGIKNKMVRGSFDVGTGQTPEASGGAGVEPVQDITGNKNKKATDSFDAGTGNMPKAVLGVGVESILGVDISNHIIPIRLYLPRPTNNGFVLPQQAFYTGQLIPEGSFAIQQDFDNKYVLTDLSYMQSLMSKSKNTISELELSLKPGADIDKVQKEISRLFPAKKYKVENRYEQNRSLYLVMQTEKWAVYAILCFIFIIAAFNMIGALSMLVIEKRKDISILKAMGAGNRLIQRIFLAEGLLISFIGAGIGTLLAVFICLGQQHFGWVKLGGATFVVSAYPVDMQWSDFLLVWVTILIVSLLASWYPARKAARQPVDLKSE